MPAQAALLKRGDHTLIVIPAQAGIHWTPAYAGVTTTEGVS